MMKLTDYDMTILKNFSSINAGVVLEKGKMQKTIAPDKSILVEAELEDDIPTKFGIYDLNQFIGTLTIFDDPDLSFKKEHIVIKDKDIVMNYKSCSPELVISPPENSKIVLKNADISFDLPKQSLEKLLRVASVNNLINLSVVSDKGELRLEVRALNNDALNIANAKVGTYDGDDFSASFKIEHLKFLPDDYFVELKFGGFGCFTSKTRKLKYFVALDAAKSRKDSK